MVFYESAHAMKQFLTESDPAIKNVSPMMMSDGRLASLPPSLNGNKITLCGASRKSSGNAFMRQYSVQ